MTVSREVEAGTLRRLQITRMSAFDLLGGTSAVLLAVTAVSVLLTFLTAAALGFRSQGPLWAAVLVGCVTGLSVIGIGMLVAGVSRTVAQAFVISNFPLGLLMFFSGGVFPLPRTTLFRAFGRDFGPFDLIPATHAVNALNKILNLGAGLGDVAFELTALVALSAVCFAAGVLVFRRVHLRPA
jgi:ABC-2 type transport system permease protein